MVYNFLRAQTQKINIHRLIVLFHTKINSMEKLFILISFELPYFCFDTPLRFRPLLKREGIYRKKLDVITFPLSSSSRGYQRFNGRTTSSRQNPLVCPKTAKRAKLNYTYRLFPDEGSLICPPGKSMIFYKKETEKIELVPRPAFSASKSDKSISLFTRIPTIPDQDPLACLTP